VEEATATCSARPRAQDLVTCRSSFGKLASREGRKRKGFVIHACAKYIEASDIAGVSPFSGSAFPFALLRLCASVVFRMFAEL
jgi:hypothetical protein